MAKTKDAVVEIDLTYSFDANGNLVSVGYSGTLTPEVYKRIKELTSRAREIGKGRDVE